MFPTVSSETALKRRKKNLVLRNENGYSIIQANRPGDLATTFYITLATKSPLGLQFWLDCSVLRHLVVARVHSN